MAHGNNQPDEPNFNNGRAYETRDVSLTALVKSLAVLALFISVSAIAAGIFFRVFGAGRDEYSVAGRLPIVRRLPDMRLQANPVQDIISYRRQENEALNGYGRDPQTGTLHIPIDRAMELALPALPIRSNPGQPDIMLPNEPKHAEGKAPPGTPLVPGPDANGIAPLHGENAGDTGHTYPSDGGSVTQPSISGGSTIENGGVRNH